MSLGALLTALIGGAALVAALLLARFVIKRRPPIADEPAYKRLERQGEQYYDELYKIGGSRGGLLSDIKDCFREAINAARKEGFTDEAKRLEARLVHIVAVYRSQFS